MASALPHVPLRSMRVQFGAVLTAEHRRLADATARATQAIYSGWLAHAAAALAGDSRRSVFRCKAAQEVGRAFGEINDPKGLPKGPERP